jgi:hypothetical protein
MKIDPNSEIARNAEAIREAAAKVGNVQERPVETFWLERDPLTGEPIEQFQEAFHVAA